MKKIIVLSALILIGMTALGNPAQAVYVGVAVESVGSSVIVPLGTPAPVGNQPGAFTFYIPLTDGASGDFGVTGISTDYCTASSTNRCGGTLDMYLLYDEQLSAGLNTFTFDFVDLDLPGDGPGAANRSADNSYFTETVDISIFEVSGSGYNNILGSAVSFSMLGPNATGDKDSQELTVTGTVSNAGNIWARLRFTSDLDRESFRWRNTPEEIYAWGGPVSVVPLPPSAILFGTALFGLAGLRRRKKKLARL